MKPARMDFQESWLQRTAREFPYPGTPDIAGTVARRLSAGAVQRPSRRVPARWVWAAAVLIVALMGLLAVPPVRAGILEFIQIGVIRIFLVQPTSTPLPATEPVPTGTAPVSTPSPVPTPTLLAWLLDLSGRTTLEAAQTRVGFPLPLPAYPSGLGTPDEVFLQDLGAPMVVLVWMDPETPPQVRMSLHIILPGGFAGAKEQPRIIQTTTVDGNPALWTTGPYLLRFRDQNLDIRRMIEGHVLIWEEEGITYRLETDQSLEEAVKIAESLR